MLPFLRRQQSVISAWPLVEHLKSFGVYLFAGKRQKMPKRFCSIINEFEDSKNLARNCLFFLPQHQLPTYPFFLLRNINS